MSLINKTDLVNMHETDSQIPYMEMDGKRFYFSTQDEFFLNSQCLFVEYTDVIKSPYIMLLNMMVQNPDSFKEYYDVDRFRGFDVPSITEWYVNRKIQNPFTEILIPKLKEVIPSIEVDKFVNNQIKEIPSLIELSPLLNFANVINQIPIGKDGIVKKLMIWYPFENDAIRSNLYDEIGDNLNFITGPLYEIIDEVPDDSTYVFSDICNIDILLEKNKLNQSSILVPSDYRYNYIEDDLLKINYEKYLDESLFKLGFFNATMEIPK